MNEPTIIRYVPRTNGAEPRQTILSEGYASERSDRAVPRGISGPEGQAALSYAMKDAWLTNPALRRISSELSRVGREVVAPEYREIAERTGLSREMRAAARRFGLRKILTGIWETDR